jgi:hypothetical protein
MLQTMAIIAGSGIKQSSLRAGLKNRCDGSANRQCCGDWSLRLTHGQSAECGLEHCISARFEQGLAWQF